MLTEGEKDKLKEEIAQDIISNLSISINSNSWGSSEYRTHEISVQLFFGSTELSSSSVMLE
jgi:hypothetical protein